MLRVRSEKEKVKTSSLKPKAAAPRFVPALGLCSTRLRSGQGNVGEFVGADAGIAG